MKKEDFLKAFAALSEEDQAAIRKELGSDPMALCKEMMAKFQEAGGPAGSCKEMKEVFQGKCCPSS